MSKQQRLALWIAGGLVVSFVLLPICRFLFFGLTADVHDSGYLSADGAYTATLHGANTGAAGSYCQVLLRRTGDSARDTVLVDGEYEFVDKVEWSSNNVLTVTTGVPPDPSWPQSWQGVKIRYD